LRSGVQFLEEGRILVTGTFRPIDSQPDYPGSNRGSSFAGKSEHELKCNELYLYLIVQDVCRLLGICDD
jgi:hypothetical protein